MDIYGENKLDKAKTRQDLFLILDHLQKIDDMPDYMIYKVISKAWYLGLDEGYELRKSEEKGK